MSTVIAPVICFVNVRGIVIGRNRFYLGQKTEANAKEACYSISLILVCQLSI